MLTQKMQVEEYFISFGDLFPELNKTVDALKPGHVFVFVDENTKKYCLPFFKRNADFNFSLISVDSGEENKNIATCSDLWQELLKNGCDRKSLVINLSGGVLSDMGGFVASTFMRGIPFINIPTTLLSMVDASVGGKTGVDFHNIKNIIGVFSNPLAVFVDPRFLKTLDKENLLSGFAEMLKHGVIADKFYLETLLKINHVFSLSLDEWRKHIYTSIKIKRAVIIADPSEKGVRKILNFGHTVGHAIETVSINKGVALSHGHAMALGMIAELYLSSQYFNYNKSLFSPFRDRVLSLYPKQKLLQLAKHDILELMLYDKKNESGEMRFVLIKQFGEADYNINIDNQKVAEALDYLFEI
ncbi:MAG: 3-dehydroquinate synthase [Bacteroidota bacterium]|nr:3-dehydroquinate synthase [Bacteroidota bacterium]